MIIQRLRDKSLRRMIIHEAEEDYMCDNNLKYLMS